MKSRTSPVPKAGNQPWGIYHTDRESALQLGDPIRTIVEAPSKIAAEEAVVRIGFSHPWAHPVSPEQVNQAQWLPDGSQRSNHRTAQTTSRGLRV